jgi:hypothetical protein
LFFPLFIELPRLYTTETKELKVFLNLFAPGKALSVSLIYSGKDFYLKTFSASLKLMEHLCKAYLFFFIN